MFILPLRRSVGIGVLSSLEANCISDRSGSAERNRRKMRNCFIWLFQCECVFVVIFFFYRYTLFQGYRYIGDFLTNALLKLIKISHLRGCTVAFAGCFSKRLSRRCLDIWNCLNSINKEMLKYNKQLSPVLSLRFQPFQCFFLGNRNDRTTHETVVPCSSSVRVCVWEIWIAQSSGRMSSVADFD